jgi:nitroreductase
MHDIIKKLEWRYATKEFDRVKKVSDEDMHVLLEAARLAPSSYGLQPWKFIVVENSELREKLKEAAWNQGQITDASHLVVLCRLSVLDEAHVQRYVEKTAEVRSVALEDLSGFKNMMIGDIQNRSKEGLEQWMAKQVYIALGFMLHTAAQMQIDTCPMEGFDPKRFDEILELDKMGLNSVVLCAIGYRKHSDSFAQAKKARFHKDEVVHVIK